MIIELRDSPFDAFDELARFTRERRDLAGRCGANAVFVGSMRDFNEGDAVSSMFLEHYPGMTERELGKLCEESAADDDVIEVLVLHRVGRVEPGEHIVLVSVWTGHRAAAFRVCRAVMESLKHRAPFWKKEEIEGGQRWVARNTPG